MKIGLFGGTFNPIHIGHLRPVEEVREFFNLDKILFILAKKPPHKPDYNLIPAELRYKILELALADNPYFYPSDIEIKREGRSYTYDTIIELKKIFANDTLFLIIGKDSFLDLKTWYNWQEILKLIDIIVLNRDIPQKKINSLKEEHYLKTINYKQIDDITYINEFEKKIYLFNNSIIEVSSSKIRENFKLQKSNKYLLPEKALKFIYEKRIYF